MLGRWIVPTQAGARLPGSGRVHLASIEVNEPRCLVTAVARSGAPPRLTVDAQGLIGGLVIRPVVPPTASTWSAIDAAVRSGAPNVHMLVADTTGGACREMYAIDPSTAPRPGSVFKLGVLGRAGSCAAAVRDPRRVRARRVIRVGLGMQRDAGGRPAGMRSPQPHHRPGQHLRAGCRPADRLICRLEP